MNNQPTIEDVKELYDFYKEKREELARYKQSPSSVFFALCKMFAEADIEETLREMQSLVIEEIVIELPEIAA